MQRKKEKKKKKNSLLWRGNHGIRETKLPFATTLDFVCVYVVWFVWKTFVESNIVSNESGTYFNILLE